MLYDRFSMCTMAVDIAKAIMALLEHSRAISVAFLNSLRFWEKWFII